MVPESTPDRLSAVRKFVELKIRGFTPKKNTKIHLLYKINIFKFILLFIFVLSKDGKSVKGEECFLVEISKQ